MMTRFLVLLSLVLGLLAVTPAQAATGYTTADLNMRTGPGVGYARIVVIPAGSAVTIEQCTQGPRWCLVRWRGYRGWVSARYLRYGGAFGLLIVPPPYLLFDYGYRDWTWRDRHYRWHRVQPYPRKKKQRPRWNREHDRWHQEHPPRKPLLRRKAPGPKGSTRRVCPPNQPGCR